jgi:multiple sugar transport system substrate-binding protein
MPREFNRSWLVPAGVLLVLAVALLAQRREYRDAAGRPVVVYAHPPCPPWLMEYYKPLFEEFQRTHPEIDFRVLHITGKYEDKIKVMFAGKVAPDVIFMYPTALASWVELGALEPLDDYLARSDDVSREDYFPAMLDTFTYKDKLYGLPKDASATLMLYNVDMFEKYGLSTPDEHWNWANLLSAAKELTRDTNGDGRIDQWGMFPYPWWIFVWQNGAHILNEAGTECLLLEPKAVEALEFWAALRWKHGVTPTPEATQDIDGWRLFALGRVGLYFQMYPIVSQLRGRCAFRWDIAPMPRGPGRRATDAVGSALAVTRQSRNKAAAFEWVRWLTSSAGMSGLTEVESPSCVALARSAAFTQSPGLPLSKHVAVEVMEYTYPPLQHPLYAELMDALAPELAKAQRGDKPVREALEAAMPRVNRVLARTSRRSKAKEIGQ